MRYLSPKRYNDKFKKPVEIRPTEGSKPIAAFLIFLLFHYFLFVRHPTNEPNSQFKWVEGEPTLFLQVRHIIPSGVETRLRRGGACKKYSTTRTWMASKWNWTKLRIESFGKRVLFSFIRQRPAMLLALCARWVAHRLRCQVSKRTTWIF